MSARYAAATRFRNAGASKSDGVTNRHGGVRKRASGSNFDVADDTRLGVPSCSRAALRPSEAVPASAAVLLDERVREPRADQGVIITDTGGTIPGVFSPMKTMRRTFYELRTEGQGPVREACAIGVGLFIGCSPFYGFHLPISWVCGRLLGLNRLKVYLAANISNPFVAPVLLLAEIQTGAWLRTGSFMPLTLQTVRSVSPWQFGADLLIGSAVIGCALGGLGGLATYLTLRSGHKDQFFDRLARDASDRYMRTSITAWEFARGKLRGDPLYRDVLLGGWLPSGGTLLDIGCGQGLMLALLAEATRVVCDGSVLPGIRLPRFDRMIGIELRPHRARLARIALGADAEIIERDARQIVPDACTGHSSVRRTAHDAGGGPGCFAVCRRRRPRAWWGNPGSRGRCVSGMAFRGGPYRQPTDGTRLGRMASAAGIPDGQRMA